MSNASFSGDYFVTPDVEEEMRVAEIVHNKKVPREIRSLLFRNGFDEGLYLKHYFDVLNQYGKRSFFNMKGFGDVSIVAATRTLVQLKKNSPSTLPLPGLADEIEVYTGDNHLAKALKKEFNGDIKVRSNI